MCPHSFPLTQRGEGDLPRSIERVEEPRRVGEKWANPSSHSRERAGSEGRSIDRRLIIARPLIETARPRELAVVVGVEWRESRWAIGDSLDELAQLAETAGGTKYITADIEVGSGANTVDEIPKGFKKEDIKVRDNAGNQVALGADKVKLTGKMMIAPAAPGGQGVCLMQVYKIEK